MKKITLFKEENWKVKQRIFKALEVEYKDNYVVFVLTDWTEQVLQNFRNFLVEDI